MSNSNRSAQESTGRQPRVLKTSPLLTTREVTDKMVDMVKSRRIMTEPIYVNDDVRRNPLSQQPRLIPKSSPTIHTPDTTTYENRYYPLPSGYNPIYQLRDPNDPGSHLTLQSTLDHIEGNPLYRTPTNETREQPLTWDDGTIQARKSRKSEGGKYSKNVYKKVGKKEVLGKDRVIYKMKGSNKEYLKTKGMYIPVSEYKKLKK